MNTRMLLLPTARMKCHAGNTTARFRISLVVLIFWTVASAAFAKHVTPSRIDPIVHGNIRYVVPNDHGLRSYVEAWDLRTCRKLWTKAIFKHFYIPFASTECMHYEYVSTLNLSDDQLMLTTDRERVFSLDLNTRAVRMLKSKPKPSP